MPHTLAQLEAFVSSPAYDAETAGLIALSIPELPRFKGEQIAPGITRIRGNLCNVHGKYGPCDKGLSGKKKPAKGRKPAAPKKTEHQRAQERTATQSARQAENTKQQALNLTKVADDTGLGDDLANLDQFGQGKPIRPQDEATLIKQGLMERGTDGAARMTEQGRLLVNAAKRGDTQRARDAISRGRDQVSASAGRTTARQERAQAATERTRAAEAKRQQREQERAKRQAAKKPSGGGGKKPEKPAVEKPRRAPAKRVARSSMPSAPVQSSSPATPKPKPAKPEKAPAKQIAPALQAAADQLSQGAKLSEADTDSLIRNGLAKLNKDGELILTAAGMRATQKAFSFKVFKDASGKYRWVAISSSAFRDRDKEIVSTKALQDDCDYADKTGNYGPLRWWHMPGVDIGDCDFNAMHGRTLIESGTFRNQFIAIAAAKAAPELEISLGFLHLPTEPDAMSIFNHIRKFERSLVPIGKASNLLTQFSVKETTPMIDTKVKEALDKLGSNPDALAYLQEVLNSATAREKALEDQKIAYKADEPATDIPDLVINGVTYKAFPPSPPTEADAVIEEDAIGDMPMDEAPAEGGLTLSPEDIAAIGSAVAEQIGPAIAQVMGVLDLEKKVAGHVQGLMAPYQTTKDAGDAEKAEQIAALQTALKDTQSKLNELLGLQPEVAPRASESPTTTINPWVPQDAQLLESIKNQVSPNDQFAFGDLVQNLFGNQTPGQA